jgi:hypothetical protein
MAIPRDLPNPNAPADQSPEAPKQARSYAAPIVAAGAAAAVVAILTSFAGIQGTVIGAMLGAMISSLGNQLMKSRLEVVERRLIRAGFSVWQLRRKGLVGGVLATPGAPLKLLRAISGRAVWKIGLIAAGGFAVGMLGISLLEFVQGRPVSAVAGSSAEEPQRGTTVGIIAAPVIDRAEAVIQPDRPTPAPTSPPPTAAPAAPPAGASPTAAPTVATPAETAAPAQATGAPTATPSAGATAGAASSATAAPAATPSATARPATSGTPAPTAGTRTPTAGATAPPQPATATGVPAKPAVPTATATAAPSPAPNR